MFISIIKPLLLQKTASKWRYSFPPPPLVACNPPSSAYSAQTDGFYNSWLSWNTAGTPIIETICSEYMRPFSLNSMNKISHYRTTTWIDRWTGGGGWGWGWGSESSELKEYKQSEISWKRRKGWKENKLCLSLAISFQCADWSGSKRTQNTAVGRRQD